MLNNTILIFTITALGGLLLAARVLSGKLARWLASIVHALLGAAGIYTLIAIVIDGQRPGKLTAALGLLVVAVLAGFLLATFHTRGRLPPKVIVMLHAGLAVVGFLIVLSVFLGL
jgi:hypothetical protein